MRYYEDESKLTFDEAEKHVKRYIRLRGQVKTRVTAKDITAEFNLEASQHNMVKLTKALREYLEVERESGARATQFKIEDDER